MNNLKLTKLKLCILAFTLLSSAASHAQQNEETTPELPSGAGIEEVVVLGQSQNDAAMSAFRSGDFKTAQDGFLKNASCALKRKRALESLVTNQTIGQQRAATAQSAQGTTSGASGGPPSPGAIAQVESQADAPSTGSIGGSFQGGAQKKAEEKQEYTCENQGFQLYMAGLSQIQLGKTDEALKNFKRATRLSRVLYDAHYRIGLISILNKDLDESRRQLKKIKTILKKCKKKCTVKDEIKVRHQHLQKSIEES